MGQAKLRGSYEQRVKESIERIAQEKADLKRLEAEKWNSLSFEEKNRIITARKKLAMITGFAMGATASLSPGRF